MCNYLDFDPYHFHRLNFGNTCNSRNEGNYIDPEGRNMVKRLLVTVSIEFATNGVVSGNDVKEKVVSCVREAVRNGSFRL